MVRSPQDMTIVRMPFGPQLYASHAGLLSDQVAQKIEQHIVDHRLESGHRLPAGRSLAEMHGVSRTVVRDAISILEQRGLVETRPGSGVFVRDGGSNAVANVLLQMLRTNAVTLREVIDARTVLETHNAEQAALLATGEDLQRIRIDTLQMESARSPSAFVEADVAFHETIAGATQNRVLAAFLASLRPLLEQGMLMGTYVSGAQDITLQAHREIQQAIENRRPSQARQAMKTHLEQSMLELALVNRNLVGTQSLANE